SLPKMQTVLDLLPPLNGSHKKGDCGRLAVFGGSEDYPGAPFYAATAMLRLGADLAHVFTEPGASAAIKNYSPELLVGKSPAFPHWLRALDGVLIGPGAGRDGASVDLVAAAIRVATTDDNAGRRPVVIDADGLWSFTQRWMEGDSFGGYTGTVILTPNANELDRLANKVLNESTKDKSFVQISEIASSLANALQCHVLAKGGMDVFATPNREVRFFDFAGSPRRPGGIGDCLAGVLTAFTVWAEKSSTPIDKAAEAASYVIREASRRAYDEVGRGMNASDVIAKISPLIREIETRGTSHM
ncbi:hypothetical protein PFISCL1PPCAC_16681, partial [Pristionchus fissidentatus]